MIGGRCFFLHVRLFIIVPPSSEDISNSSCPHYHRYRPFFVLSFRFVLFLLLDVVAGSNPCEAVATFAVQHSLFFVSWRNVAVQHQHRCDGEHEQEPSVTFLAWM